MPSVQAEGRVVVWADRSPGERAALTYCAPRGVPLSVFQGRTVYPGEPMWLEDDMLAALEWQAEQARLCSGCGHNLDDTMGPANSDKWNAEIAGACDACKAIDRAARIAAGVDDLDANAGVRYRTWRDEEDTDGRLTVAG